MTPNFTKERIYWLIVESDLGVYGIQITGSETNYINDSLSFILLSQPPHQSTFRTSIYSFLGDRKSVV